MHFTTSRLRGILEQHRPKPIGVTKEFAILLPLFQKQGQWHILFEKRSKHISQPGEVSFPGGAIEDGETPWEAAVRETYEEIGLNPTRIAYVGEWNPLVTHFGYYIHVFIGEIDGRIEEEFVENQEVETVFHVPLSYFWSQEATRYEAQVHVEQPADFPYGLVPQQKDYPFRKETRSTDFWEYDDYVIWGMTAKILGDFIETLKEKYDDNTT